MIKVIWERLERSPSWPRTLNGFTHVHHNSGVVGRLPAPKNSEARIILEQPKGRCKAVRYAGNYTNRNWFDEEPEDVWFDNIEDARKYVETLHALLLGSGK